MIERKPFRTAKLNVLIAILKTKDTAWEVTTEFLRKNNQAQLAERLNLSADAFANPDARHNLALKDKIQMFEQKSLIYGSNAKIGFKPAAVQHRSTTPPVPPRILPKPTVTVVRKTNSSGNVGCSTNLNASDEDVVSTPTDSYKIVKSTPVKELVEAAMLLAALKEKSKLQLFAQLLPGIISFMQIYSTNNQFQLECMQLIQTSLPQKLSELTAELKAILVETMLTCLQSNFNDEIVACCAEVLTKLEIFSDPIDKYAKTVEILLKIISNPEMTMTTKRSTIVLLARILLKSHENRRNLVGQMGGVETTAEQSHLRLDIVKQLDLLQKYLLYPLYDQNDQFLVESHVNKKKFLSVGGVDIFHLIYEKFGDKVEMVEELVGMMFDLSHFTTLLPQLVTKKNFEVLWKILLKFDNHYISYRIVRFFDNFLSDSTTIWPLDSPTVEEAENLLVETVSKWKLDAQISFEPDFNPLLNQLKLHNSHLSDLLIIWTITNFTTIDAPKYCRMLRDEGGAQILTTEVIRCSNSSLNVIRLAILALDNVKRWESTVAQPNLYSTLR